MTWVFFPQMGQECHLFTQVAVISQCGEMDTLDSDS